ncbi:MAG: hypothetical protein Q9M19_05160 [Mariprofundaceae bacterium]|nr:hypothetical protein [Mariprofundaceae bacterium]
MRKKQQSRHWIFASVAVVLLLFMSINKLNHQQLYHSLQQQLANTGIALQAKNIQLSWMYLGSIRLDGVNMQSDHFQLSAQHLFIDLDLAALLTGKALAQALYLQLADIDVEKNQTNTWLKLIDNDSFKLKRIDISQSEIHFAEQHLTLKQVDLDIRDIGKNKSPRLELRAHIGDGRIDAHGYLHLKRGEITRGFGRVRLFDIPVQPWLKHTRLHSLNGTITTHINQDSTWQALGHLAIQDQQLNQLELRGKVLRNIENIMDIQDMVLHINQAGAFNIQGQCSALFNCKVQLQSERIALAPVFSLLNQEQHAEKLGSSRIQDVNMALTWENEVFSSSGHAKWQSLFYDTITLAAGKIELQDLSYQDGHGWQLDKLNVRQTDEDHASLSLEQASYVQERWILPLHLQHSALWLPLAQTLETIFSQESPKLQGSGLMHGQLLLHIKQQQLQQLNMDIYAQQAHIIWQQVEKPLAVPSFIRGEITWQDHVINQAEISLGLAKSRAEIDYIRTEQHTVWKLEKLNIDISQWQDMGIQLPTFWQAWHGRVQGDIMFKQAAQQRTWSIDQATLQLANFGDAGHQFDGDVKKNGRQWWLDDVMWKFQQQQAVFSSVGSATVRIKAARLDAQNLMLLAKIEGFKGHLQSRILHLPFADFENFSSTLQTSKHGLQLSNSKSDFHQGTLRSKLMHIRQDDARMHFSGSLQLGNVHLKPWAWLQQQFQNPLRGNLYATLNLQASFDDALTLHHWSGDGDVQVYNAQWLRANDHLHADSLQLKLRKRKQFAADINVENGRNHGSGKLLIDAQHDSSGYLQWLGKRVHFSHDWQHMQFTTNDESAIEKQ